jgi:hypothetical protein
MNPGSKAFARAALHVAAALLLAQLAASAARAQDSPPPRRPSGPAAGPIIKLPRGDGASLEQQQSNPEARERGERAAAEPKRWEYCAITGFVWQQKGLTASTRAPSAVIRFFPNTTEEVEGAHEEDALANAFARLGDDGWELAGVRTDTNLTEGNGRSATVYFFKRPRKPE